MGSSRFIPDTIAPNLPPNPKYYSNTSLCITEISENKTLYQHPPQDQQLEEKKTEKKAYIM
jgi:hypothetical protein